MDEIRVLVLPLESPASSRKVGHIPAVSAPQQSGEPATPPPPPPPPNTPPHTTKPTHKPPNTHTHKLLRQAKGAGAAEFSCKNRKTLGHSSLNWTIIRI